MFEISEPNRQACQINVRFYERGVGAETNLRENLSFAGVVYEGVFVGDFVDIADGCD